MRHPLHRLAVALLLLGLASCSGDGPEFIWFRAIHAVPDAPDLRLRFDEYVFRERVTFGSASSEGAESLLQSSAPPAAMTLEYFAPNNEIGDTVLTLDVPVEQDAVSTVVLAGSFDSVEPVVVLTPRRPRPLGSLYFQFVHAVPGEGPLDVYVTAPDTELTATAPLATIQSLGHSESLEVPFGTTRIRLTAAGSLDVVMDSGELDFPAQEDSPVGPGAEWLFAVSPSIVPGPAPVFLIGSNGRSAATFFAEGTPATLRAFNAARSHPSVDVAALTEPPEVLATDIGFRQRSALVPAPIGDLTLQFRPAGQPDDAIANVAAITSPAGEYAAILREQADVSIAGFFQSNTRAVVTAGKLRFAHLAGSTGPISAYLTESEDEAPDASNRLLFQRPPGDVTSHLTVAPSDYFLTVTLAGAESAADETVLAGPLPLAVEGGEVFTFGLFEPDNEGEPPVLVQFDDRMP